MLCQWITGISLWAPPPDITALTTLSAAEPWRPGWGYTRCWCVFITSNSLAPWWEGSGSGVWFHFCYIYSCSNCAPSKWFKIRLLVLTMEWIKPNIFSLGPAKQWPSAKIEKWKKNNDHFKFSSFITEPFIVRSITIYKSSFFFSCLLLLHSLVLLPSPSFVILLPLNAQWWVIIKCINIDSGTHTAVH